MQPQAPDDNPVQAETSEEVKKLEKELEAAGKRSLNYSILLILIILPFLLLLFFIGNSGESPTPVSHGKHASRH